MLINSLSPSKNDLDVLSEAVGKLYVKGFNINWDKVYKSRDVKKIPLPPYPFNRKSYWFKELKNIEDTSSLNESINKVEMNNPLMRGKKIKEV